ncbi:MAG: DUF1571 domain-containing protein [Myxococcota bacterium]
MSLALAVPPAPDDTAALAFQAGMERMAAVNAGLKGCTFTFRSQEYVDGATTDWSTADVKFRVEEDIYMSFTAGPNEGRKVLYRGPDWNGGKFRVDPGRWMPVLSLHPDSRLARRGGRHSIRELPLTRLGAKILTDAIAVRDHPTWKPDIDDLGTQSIGGSPARCYDSRLPKSEDASLYAHRVEICLDDATGLPARLKIWDHEDGSVRLVESYEYRDLKVNPGLTDADFDPDTYGL